MYCGYCGGQFVREHPGCPGCGAPKRADSIGPCQWQDPHRPRGLTESDAEKAVIAAIRRRRWLDDDAEAYRVDNGILWDVAVLAIVTLPMWVPLIIVLSTFMS